MCLVEILVEDHKVGDDALQRVNRVRKHQEEMFLSNIATAGGNKMDSYYVEDWTRCHERTTWKHRSDLVFRKEHPTKEDWRVWKRELSRLHSNLERCRCHSIDGSTGLTTGGSTGWTRRKTS